MRNAFAKMSDSKAEPNVEVNKSEIILQVIMRGWWELKGNSKAEIQTDRSLLIILSMALSAAAF